MCLVFLSCKICMFLRDKHAILRFSVTEIQSCKDDICEILFPLYPHHPNIKTWLEILKIQTI